MPLNPKGTMFPFNGDISGVVAAVGRCSGWGLAWFLCHRMQLVLRPFSAPTPYPQKTSSLHTQSIPGPHPRGVAVVAGSGSQSALTSSL